MSGKRGGGQVPADDCGDCGARPGEKHHPRCDVPRCLVTGLQRFSCDLAVSPLHDCGEQIWTGACPGDAECELFGWFSRMTPGGWVACEPGWPGAGPDVSRLNPLGTKVYWDRGACRWRRYGDPEDDATYLQWHFERGLAVQPAVYVVDGARFRYPEEWPVGGTPG